MRYVRGEQRDLRLPLRPMHQLLPIHHLPLPLSFNPAYNVMRFKHTSALSLLKNEESPGTFQSSLDNNLPKIQLGELEPPAVSMDSAPITNLVDAPSSKNTKSGDTSLGGSSLVFSDLSASTASPNKSNFEPLQKAIINRGDVPTKYDSDQLLDNIKIYRKKDCRIEDCDGLLRAWKVGNALILHGNGSIVSYADAVSISGDFRA